MTKYHIVLNDMIKKLEKSLDHLEFSFKKVGELTREVPQMDDETMEVWESFTTRFGRSADIFLNRYLRTLFLLDDPAYEGSLRDSLNKSKILSEIKSIIGEQKIDLLIETIENRDTFIQSVLPDSILLHSFGYP